jgi:hypothetical protein
MRNPESQTETNLAMSGWWRIPPPQEDYRAIPFLRIVGSLREWRCVTWVRWLECKSKQPTPGSPQTIIGFILRGKKSAKAAKSGQQRSKKPEPQAMVLNG